MAKATKKKATKTKATKKKATKKKATATRVYDMHPALHDRLLAQHAILMAAHTGSNPLSNAAKGGEREDFVEHFLAKTFGPGVRFGMGDVTDHTGFKTGQLDIVIEYAQAYSLNLGVGRTRLYPAEAVAAVIEVKSDLTKQDEEARKTLGAVRKLKLFHLHDELLQSALAAESLAEAFRRPLDPKAQAFLAEQGIAPPDTESEVEEFRDKADKYRAAARQQASRSRIPTFLVGFRGWKDFDSYRDKSALNADVVLSLKPLVFTHHLWGQDTTRPICITRVRGAPALFHFLEALRVQIWHRAAMPTMTETYA